MNYKNFYLGILCGTSFFAGMFYSASFGFFTLKFLVSLCFTFFPMWMFYLFIKELQKERKR